MNLNIGPISIPYRTIADQYKLDIFISQRKQHIIKL